MVQVKIHEKEKVEEKTQEYPHEAPEVTAQTDEEGKDQGQKEIPLEDMKKANLIEKAKDLKKTAEENYDLYIRSQAEIDNLKKRFQKEKTDLIKFSNELLIKQLLTVIDNLEKAISASQNENSIDSLRKGVELTLKGLTATLEKSGLSQVKAEGAPFDPNFHEALFEKEDKSAAPGTVLQVLQKGYTLNERLIRPAMVVVNKNNA